MSNETPFNKIEEEKIKEKIIGKLFPEVLASPEELENKYPPRELKAGAMVTRIAPSPTGFMHLGGLYTALICDRLAHQSEGVFYLRIEDTDKKREIEGASALIVKSLSHYGIQIDEGEITPKQEIGKYGPYTQSERATIYKTFVKSLFIKGFAYPCFCTNEELEEMRGTQEAQGIRPGYYKQWAKWRDKSDSEILKALEEGKQFVIRFKSDGNFNNKIIVNDIIMGEKELSENDQDIIIMKSDGLPTYHMAHVVDDHLMRTTHVIRGNEWLNSLPLHLQLFKTIGWDAPKYGHIYPIQKMEDTSKRKLSKRKDPEANVEYYDQQGYPENAVIEYLLNLANSNFEDWRKANLTKDNRDFILTLGKLSESSGPLFDPTKLNDISKDIIARYTAEEVYAKVLDWSRKYDKELTLILENNAEYIKKILNIERSSVTTVRKDIGKWSDVKNEISYFLDQNFHITKEDIYKQISNFSPEDIDTIIKSFLSTYNETDSVDDWFEKIKIIARSFGLADSTKAFKKNPEKFKGSVADVAKILRVFLSGKSQTPDLHSIMKVMGKDRVIKRLSLTVQK